MIRNIVMAPFAASFGILVLLGIALTVYVLFDVIFRQDEMDVVEKLIWIVVVLSFNLFGVLAYLILVVHQDRYLFDSALFGGEGRKITQLERLQDLHDSGALTDEEFEQEKEKLLED